jgi:hypothetical protein
MRAMAAFRLLSTLGVFFFFLRPTSAKAQTCMYDTDCTANGTACGTDVCSWATNPRQCVPANSDPGQCGGDAECKCAAEGATCTMIYCSFTSPPDSGTEASSADAESDAPITGTLLSDASDAEDATDGAGMSEGGCPASGGEGGARGIGPESQTDGSIAQSDLGANGRATTCAGGGTRPDGFYGPFLSAVWLCASLWRRRRVRQGGGPPGAERERTSGAR